jgi:UDP-N-acetylglucosamine 2-epimerase (non-hydrolysing)
MVLYLIGTKAQYIKMAPVILESERQKLPYQLIYTGQHSETFDDLQANFGLRPPDLILVEQPEATDRQSFSKWLLRAYRAAKSSYMRNVLDDVDAVVVHGDTASTLLGTRIAKQHRRLLVHVEAGLRSFNYFHPFPEEIIRVLVSKSTNLHCCPDDTAINNLDMAKVRGERLLTDGNTLIDALRIAGKQAAIRSGTPSPYGIFSMHRQENLFNKHRLHRALALLERLSTIVTMQFVLHPVTRTRLEALGCMSLLSNNPRIKLVPRMDFFAFNKLLRAAQFVVTDGGSNQEECALLAIPCVILRRATERSDGIGRNALLGDLNIDRIMPFVRAAVTETQPRAILPAVSPSRIIVNRLMTLQRNPYQLGAVAHHGH